MNKNEKQINEVFEYDGHKLIVKESTSDCQGCYFYDKLECPKSLGFCYWTDRSDKKNVIFIEEKENDKPNNDKSINDTIDKLIDIVHERELSITQSNKGFNESMYSGLYSLYKSAFRLIISIIKGGKNE